jgi:hypothetical protein
MLSPYQPLPQSLPYSGSISPAFLRVPQPLPSRMLRLAMITLPVASSFSVVNPKAAFHSSRPTCAPFLPFLLLSRPSIVFSSVSTSTPSPGPLHPLKVERPPRHRPQGVPPSGAVISPQASMSFSLFFAPRPTILLSPPQAVVAMLLSEEWVLMVSPYLTSG